MQERVSERQQEFLDFMKHFEEMHGCSPTFREIAIGMGISSKGSVSAMIDMLHSMGLIEKAHGASRGTQTRDPVQASH
jgi:SOS-response transcriptional repressor LexA